MRCKVDKAGEGINEILHFVQNDSFEKMVRIYFVRRVAQCVENDGGGGVRGIENKKCKCSDFWA